MRGWRIVARLATTVARVTTWRVRAGRPMATARLGIAAAAVVAAIGLAACGGSAPVEGALCETEGAGSQTGEGVDVMCERMGDGQLVWVASGEGARRGQVSREMWDLASAGCPEAVVDTGYELVLIDGGVVYGSDQGTAERIDTECPDAVRAGRERDYGLSVDGVDYVTQLERAGATVPTLNDHFSQGQCVGDAATLGRSFAASADAVEMVWPLGMVSYKHVIPTDHVYVQWVDMTPGANDLIVPADGFVVDVEGVGDDFRVVIELSCNDYIAYGHVDEFAGPIAQLADEFGDGHRRLLTRIPVAAGDVVARGGEVMTDVWYWDQEARLEGVRAANYLLHNGMNLYAVDPFDYWTDPETTKIAAKIAGASAATGGRIGWNEQGTARGGWYQLDTLGERGPTGSWLDHIELYSEDLFGPWDGSLSWAPDGLDPDTWLFAVGRFNDRGSVIGITRDNVSPTSLTPGSAPVALELYDFDYETDGGEFFSRDDPAQRRFAPRLRAVPNAEKLGVVVLQLVDDTTLKVEKRPGADADATPEFTGTPLTYTR